jgi:hypothetical protein
MNRSNDHSNDKRVTSTTDRNASGKSTEAGLEASGKQSSFGKQPARDASAPSNITGGSTADRDNHGSGGATKR